MSAPAAAAPEISWEVGGSMSFRFGSATEIFTVFTQKNCVEQRN
jgi:hypothetical protein